MMGPRKSTSRNKAFGQRSKPAGRPQPGRERPGTQARVTIGQQQIGRILDANLNRAREGLRVAEEIARMILEDETLQKKIKHLRHQLSLLEKRITLPPLLRHRSTQNDPGARHTSPQEKQREDVMALARANLRRCQEACRVLEEFSKLEMPAVSPRFKALRFEAYGLEQELVDRLEPKKKKLHLPPYHKD